VDQLALFDHTLWHAAELVGADAGVLRLLDRSGGLVAAASYRVPETFLERHLRIPLDIPEALFALESSGPVVLHQPPQAPGLRELLKQPIGTLILAPIGVGHMNQGLLALACHTERELPETEFLALRMLTDLVAVTMLNDQAYSDLERTSRTDALTGLSTRRHFEELFRRELARARRHNTPLCLAMIDVDRLKWINDTFGHPMGDRVIAAVGGLLQHVRTTDVTARFGGDEFVILMPDTELAAAEIVCERLRDHLDELNNRGEFPFRLDVSIGVREMGGLDCDMHGEELLAKADAAMYHRKRSTRQPVIEDVDEEMEPRLAG
jgi:diguanylate cyclase (GGDEF)-like protein